MQGRVPGPLCLEAFMDLDFTDEENAFRDEVRTWLAENAPREKRPDGGQPMREFDLAWQRRQYDGGWAGIAWDREHGGRGATLLQQLIWFEEYARAGLPGMDSTFVGMSHAGPTLMMQGSDEQQAFHLPKILKGEVIWCQGFSEPDAGSDLASLKTRAVIEGDELVVSGQKIWTSFAAIADYQELLVRTSTGGRKHDGITWTICDMHSPGIEVRPIKTMAGDADFCEVFYNDVRIPLANVVGTVDNGWRVAMSTLGFERGTAFTASQVRLGRTVENLVEAAHDFTDRNGRAMAEDDEIGHRLASARAQVAALRAMTYATISRNAQVSQPGPEGSMIRLYYTELEKAVAWLAMDIVGPDAMALGGALGVHDAQYDWPREYLNSFSASIGGGTSEIQRNIIGERVLGLPR
jgi:alkylation response protein AidB-like acyl-CoA dehydrogenase